MPHHPEPGEEAENMKSATANSYEALVQSWMACSTKVGNGRKSILRAGLWPPDLSGWL